MTIDRLLTEKGYLITDGAMGTMLFAAGLTQGGAPELYNVEHPEKVSTIQQAYIQAGAQIILTNSFGGNRLRLGLHNLEARVRELNLASVKVARRAVLASGAEVLVAGDIGPSGQVLEPYGELTFTEAVEAFNEQASALIEGGVDLIWIETMASLDEVRAAIQGVRGASGEIPIISTMTFDTRGRTMMGVTPEQAVNDLLPQGVFALGANCGNGPDEIISVIDKMHAVSPSIKLVAKSNAGIPTLVQGKTVYRATPEDMAIYARQAYQAGARIIGACCGSTPEHISTISQALAQ